MTASLPAWLTSTAIAHRGLHDAESGIPENSIKAFDNAIRSGYAIELDVQVIEDGEVIVFHDYDLKRMCNRPKEVMSLVSSDLQYYKLLQTQEQIPLFKDVLRFINGKVPLLVEIKRQPGRKNANMIILNTLLGYKGEIAIQSFDPNILSWFSVNAPFLLRGQLSSDFKQEKMNPVVKYLLKNCRLNFISKPHFIAYDVRALPNARVEGLRKKGKIVLGWTVTNEGECTRAKTSCDNMIFEGFRPR